MFKFFENGIQLHSLHIFGLKINFDEIRFGRRVNLLFFKKKTMVNHVKY